VTLHRLALSRSTVDRAAHRRAEPDLLGELAQDPKTLVLLLHSDVVPVLDTPAGPALLLLPAPQGLALPAPQPLAVPDPAAAPAGEPTSGLRVYLGELDGASYLLAAAAGPAATIGFTDPPEQVLPELPVPGARWAGLRELGTLLDDTGAGLLTAGVAVANWHATHPRCARCGQPTEPIQAGWARRCPSCGAEHYPRTDPAVIMSVIDADDRILLGRQRVWPAKRYSTLAGFVEPGESLEAAVRREVLEESAVLVDRVEYLGSQPWPFPSSLMLGFRATAVSTSVTVDGEELTEARWWTREQLLADVRTRELLLPPGLSIARRLIEDWYGGPIVDADEAWR
jgi:NAD+ diphosphatase